MDVALRLYLRSMEDKRTFRSINEWMVSEIARTSELGQLAEDTLTALPDQASSE